MPAFSTYNAPLTVLTIQADIVAIFPSSYNAILVLLEFIIIVGFAQAIFSAVQCKKLDAQLRTQKPLIVHDFAAFHKDFRYLTLSHLTKVLKHGIPSRPQPLRSVTLNDSIDPSNVQAHIVTPAVSSTSAPRPQHVELTLSCQSNRGVTAHVFAHVPLPSVLSYLKAVDRWDCNTRRFGPPTFKSSLSLVRRLKDYCYMGFKALCTFTARRTDPIVQELLDVSERRTHTVEPLLPIPPPVCDQPLVSLAQRYFSSCVYRSCPFPSNGSKRMTFLVDEIFGQPASESDVQMVILLSPMESGRKVVDEVFQFVLFDGLNDSSTFSHSLELFLHDASTGHRGRRPSASALEDQMVGVSAQQPVYGLDDPNDSECLICLSCQKNAILLPCRHCAACVECLQGLFQDKCPICRSNFQGWIQMTWV